MYAVDISSISNVWRPVSRLRAPIVHTTPYPVVLQAGQTWRVRCLPQQIFIDLADVVQR